MSQFWLLSLLFAFLLPGIAVPAALRAPLSAVMARATATPTLTPTPTVSINSPSIGQALQGNVSISGNTAIDGFSAAALYFGYTNDPTHTWFLLQSFDQPVANAVLAGWDTTTISDGIYDLKLSVTLQDGSRADKLVQGLRVRNYTPIETNTPTPVTPSPTPLPGAPTSTPTPTATPILPTGTPLPTNPAELSVPALTHSLGQGALVVIGFFAILGLYGLLRRRRD